MGISNLNKFLRNNCPDIFEEIHISEYSFKKVAIDISLYLCKFKTICGDKWLHAFINLVACLRKNEVHCVFIYDSGCVPEKEAERKERAEQRKKLENKVCKLENALSNYYLTNEIDEILVELYNKRNKDCKEPRRLLSKVKDKIDIEFVDVCIKKMRNQILDICPEDFQKTKDLFKILNVPYYNAPLEAETTCSDLCKRGLVDAVLSEDTDVLAYASPIFLSKINTTNGTCIRIKYPHLLSSLKLQCNQFLDLCIMCGTDYNKNIYGIGPEKAFKYIKQYSDIDSIGKSNPVINISILNHIRTRQLFRGYEQLDVIIPYCGMPVFQLLKEFVFKHNINCNIEALKKSFIYNITIFCDDEEIEEIEEIENNKENQYFEEIEYILEEDS